MKVSDLQQYLLDLGTFLEKTGGGKVAKELNRLSQGLGPFSDQTLGQLIKTLNKTQEPTPSPSATSASPKGSKKLSAEEVDQIAQRLREMYDRVTEPSVTIDAIETELKLIDPLTVPNLKSVAEALGIKRGISGKRREELVKIIRAKLIDQKGMFQRTDL